MATGAPAKGRGASSEPPPGPGPYVTEQQGLHPRSSRRVRAHRSSYPLATRLFLRFKKAANLTERLGTGCRLPTAPPPRVEGRISPFCTCIRVFLISICPNSERQLPFGRSLFHLFPAIAPVQLWSLG